MINTLKWINGVNQMAKPLNIFVGYDKVEQLAFDVYSYTLNKYSSKPLSITQIRLDQLKDVMTRPKHPLQSNEFAFSRFLVPYLCNFKGWALFTDIDYMARGDISELFDLADPKYAAMVVKHNYEVTNATKFLNTKQTKYMRKNWSSTVLWNCEHPANKVLMPHLINQEDTDDFNVGLHLHQFRFLQDQFIGEIPNKWNHLVGIYEKSDDAKLVHWTNFGPWLDGHGDEDYAGEWFSSWYEMMSIRRA